MIREYYGEEIAIYFEWMNFFLQWIAVPAGLAVIIKVLNSIFFEDVSKSPLSAAFSIGMALWASMFAVYWKRHQKSLRILWDNLYSSEHKIQAIRPDFVGEPRLNHVTGEIEPDYPASSRIIRYLESFLTQFLITISIVIPFLICCYNFTGVITENSPFKAFVIPVLADLAKPEAIFDVETNWNLLGTIAQVVLTLILNMSFRSIAVWCTDRENHKYN